LPPLCATNTFQMDLDHIFIFSQEHDLLADSLQKFGLSEGTPNVHPGQGTACRRFYFHNAYLELVWVVNEVETKSVAIAPAKLWERSQYHLTNHCPFGLCFRTSNQPSNSINLLFADGWRYYSSFLPEGQFANIASNENFPAEPMLFEMPFFGLAPKDYPLSKQQLLTHAKEVIEITNVSFTLPTSMKNLSVAMKKVLQESIVNVSEGVDYGVSLEFDYGANGKVHDFFPLAPLALKW
jgi:hypothetical protein